MVPVAILLLLIPVVLETVEQLAFADAARHPARKWSRWVTGWIAHAGGILIWLPILTLLPMSEALPLTGLCYVSTVIAARIFLEERVSLRRWVAVLVIVCGATLICLAGGPG